MQLWVLLFNTDPDNQGIYARWESGQNTVIAFADEDDATRYGLMLEAQDFLCPTPEPIDEEELRAFCEEAGYELSIVREDDLVIPPERNIEEPDWQADSKHHDVNPLEFEEQTNEVDEIEKMRRRLEGLM